MRNRVRSERGLKQATRPAGMSMAAMWRSVKYEVHAGGWCSLTLAMMGMYLEA